MSSLSPDSRRIAAVAGLLSIVLVVGYFAWHKPLSPEALVAIGSLLGDVAIGLALILTALGLGSWVRRQWFGENRQPSIDLALGLGGLSLIWLGMGALGLFRPISAWLLLAVLGILTYREWIAALRELIVAWRRARPGDGFETAIALLALVLLVVPLFDAHAPPIKYDALLYHLSLPKHFARTGGLHLPVDNPLWGYPLSAEMHYTWATLLSGESAAAVFGWLVGIGAVVLQTIWIANWSRRGAWLACAALLAGSTTTASLGWGYTDWHLALYGLAILIALKDPAFHRSKRQGLLIGLLCGLALGVKWSAASGIAGGMLALVVVCRGEDRWRALILALGAMTLVYLPWLLKNQLGAGHPLFPLYGRASGMTGLRQSFFREDPGGLAKAALLALPASATFLGFEGAPGFGADIGPLLLAMLPGLILLGREERTSQLATSSMVGAGWIGWAVLGATTTVLVQSRLHMTLFPAWAVMAGMGGVGLSRVRLHRIRGRVVVQTMVLLVLILQGVSAVRGLAERRSLEVALGGLDEEQYLAHNLGTTFLAHVEVAERYEAKQVLMLWEARGFYCQPICRSDAILDRWWSARRAGMTNEEILDSWRVQGAEALLIHRAGAEFMRANDLRYHQEDWQSLSDLLADLPHIESFGQAYELYGLLP